MHRSTLTLLLFSTLALACGHADDGDIGGNETEVITTAILSFVPDEGGATIEAVFDDPDGDGGQAPSVDAINLSGGAYSLSLRFENRLESPPEDITVEIEDEGEEHQIFFTGSAVDGPASDQPAAPLSHSYADEDAKALPIGLQNLVAASTGSGELIVTLRHLPKLGGVQQKTEGTSSLVRESGFPAIGGSTDAQLSFPVTVE